MDFNDAVIQVSERRSISDEIAPHGSVDPHRPGSIHAWAGTPHLTTSLDMSRIWAPTTDGNMNPPKAVDAQNETQQGQKKGDAPDTTAASDTSKGRRAPARVVEFLKTFVPAKE